MTSFSLGAGSVHGGDVDALPRRLDLHELRRHPLVPTSERADKESRGHIVVIAGSREVPGAAVLTAVAALRAGAGKLTIATAASVAVAIALKVPEARVIGLPETDEGGLKPSAIAQIEKCLEKADAVVFGPGLTDTSACSQLGGEILLRCPEVPVVLDAGALDTAISGVRLSPNVLLTPHHGEMAHLLARKKSVVADEAVALAAEMAAAWQACVALKAASTVIALPTGQCWLHEGDEPGLATSGSGDVLAGIIGGLAASGTSVAHAALWGVALHAMAGRALAARSAPVGYLARELAGEVPRLLHRLTQRRSV